MYQTAISMRIDQSAVIVLILKSIRLLTMKGEINMPDVDEHHEDREIEQVKDHKADSMNKQWEKTK